MIILSSNVENEIELLIKNCIDKVKEEQKYLNAIKITVSANGNRNKSVKFDLEYSYKKFVDKEQFGDYMQNIEDYFYHLRVSWFTDVFNNISTNAVFAIKVNNNGEFDIKNIYGSSRIGLSGDYSTGRYGCSIGKQLDIIKSKIRPVLPFYRAVTQLVFKSLDYRFHYIDFYFNFDSSEIKKMATTPVNYEDMSVLESMNQFIGLVKTLSDQIDKEYTREWVVPREEGKLVIHKILTSRCAYLKFRS